MMCNTCIHKIVCSKYIATGGVNNCEHYFGPVIKTCALCGRQFIPKRADAIYCDSPSPAEQSLTCKEYNSRRLFYQKQKEDEAKHLARNISTALRMQVKRHPEDTAYQIHWECFATNRAQWQADLKNGTKTKEEYISWLRKFKNDTKCIENEVSEGENV
jgi:hypothetical protein